MKLKKVASDFTVKLVLAVVAGLIIYKIINGRGDAAHTAASAGASIAGGLF